MFKIIKFFQEFVVARAAKRLKLGEPSPPAPTMSAKLKAGQRDKLRTFLQIANCDEIIAQKCLNNADWNIERALDIFYQTPSFQESSSGCDARKIDALFNAYANDKEDLKQTGVENRIGPNGMLRLLNDLHVDPSSVDALILAWKMKAETQCEFSQEEFKNGCIQMRVDTIDKMRNQVSNWRNEIKDTQKFKQLYQFAFNYAKSAATRFLEIDTAVAYWNLIFEDRDSRVPIWIEFLKNNKTRGVSRDTWNLFFDFLVQTMDTYDNYDAEGAWPVMIDEFVDYAKTRKS
ncbi:unnamed protein product [Bursaphelenchus xylophilus]|uniref:Defective in cullin neddylation protein n=1 Tax=Bursaphelenchus xylophilus TaxID=6326 RepID=A0A1I7SDA6_BURXY|nr:unnamed protein product [Bursaphelenchus xylophilus]CAG9130563.1 unnamed protein product [Bursaphelenchus xylophilus]